MNSKKIDILVLIGLIFIWILYAYLTKNSFLGKATIVGLVYAIPATTYLSFRKKKNWKKIIVSTIIFGGMFGFVFEFIAEYSKAYSVVSNLFPFKLFGILPLDNVMGHMMMTMLTVTFYEHFVDREKNPHISKNLKKALLPSIAVIIVLIFVYFFKPILIPTQFPYFKMGLAAITPPLYLSLKNPHILKKMAETSVFFFFLYFVAEIMAVKLNFWIYPGNNYVGWVTVFNTTFPFEELFFWMMFYAASLVSYYEIFIDDES